MGLLTAEPPWVGLTASDLLEVRHAHNLPSLIATHASELAGCAVAIYVVDLDGSSLLRLAGGVSRSPIGSVHRWRSGPNCRSTRLPLFANSLRVLPRMSTWSRSSCVIARWG